MVVMMFHLVHGTCTGYSVSDSLEGKLCLPRSEVSLREMWLLTPALEFLLERQPLTGWGREGLDL